MLNLLKNRCDQVAAAIACEGADSNWQITFDHALAVKPVCGLSKAISGALPVLNTFGNWLDLISFAAVLILSFVLPLPQFASDKEGLAFIVVGALIMRVLGTICGGKEKYSPTSMDALIIAFLATNVVAAFASRYFADSLLGLAKVVVYTASYFLFTATLNKSPKKVVAVISALITSGLLVSLYGLYQYKIGVAPLATWEDPSVESKVTRIYSTLNNPNLLAGYLVPLFPLALGLAGAAVSLRRWIISALPAGTALIILAALLLTGSRGGFIAAIAMLIAWGLILFQWLWFEKTKTRPVLIAAVFIVPVLMALALHFVPGFEQRFVSIFEGREHSSNSYRLNVWISSWQMFLDNWWFGIGPGNKTFRLAYGLYMISGFDALGTYCVPLEIAVETGIVGLIIFIAMIALSLSRAHLTFWQAKGYVRWLAAGIAVAIIGVIAHGFVDTVFFRPQVQLIFWFLISASVSLRQFCAGAQE